MSEISTEERKRVLRAAAISRRKSLPVKDAESWSRRIQESVIRFPPYQRAPKVALYSPLPGEVDTRLIREDALSARKMILYSSPQRSDPPELLKAEATGDRPVDLSAEAGSSQPPGYFTDGGELLIIIPGLLFDGRGNRLGRGGGWYDQLLGGFATDIVAVALAYEFQVIDEVPVQEWDRPVNYIVTERRVIDCARERSSLAS